MGDSCEVLLEKEAYSPGETVNGRIECNFAYEIKIKGIRVKIAGGGRVSWKSSRFSYRRAEEIYLDLDLDVVSGEMTIPPGVYQCPFTFTLPSTLPSSMSEGDPTYTKDVASILIPIAPIDVHYGHVEYNVTAVIERSWAGNMESKMPLRITACYDLNAIDGLEKPIEVNKAVKPAGVFKESGPIKVTVQLPMTGFAPSQTVAFTLSVNNSSSVEIQYIQFKFVQGFTFLAEQQTKSFDAMIGEECVVKDSTLPTGNEKTWQLIMKVPSLFLGNFAHSNIVKAFWELRGEVSLPFPHYNFNVHVPITLGAKPLHGASA